MGPAVVLNFGSVNQERSKYGLEFMERVTFPICIGFSKITRLIDLTCSSSCRSLFFSQIDKELNQESLTLTLELEFSGDVFHHAKHIFSMNTCKLAFRA